MKFVIHVLLLTACGGSSSQPLAVQHCDPTHEGAQSCASHVCVTIGCAQDSSNWTTSVCATIQCAATCDVGFECVTFTDGGHWCVPSESCHQ